jgi:hypothetical protein
VEDVRRFVHPVFRHRFGLNFTAVSEGYDTDNIIDRLLEAVPVIPDDQAKPGYFVKLFGRTRKTTVK